MADSGWARAFRALAAFGHDQVQDVIVSLSLVRKDVRSAPHGPIGPILPVIGKYYGDLLWVSSRKLPLLRAHRRASVQPSSRHTAIETIAWSRRRGRSNR